MSRILVTGAAGFIGSHLCEAFLRDGAQVVGLDNLDHFYDPAVKQSNLHALQSSPEFEFVEGDIRDAELIADLTKTGFSAIVHLAARAGVRPSIDDPQLYCDVNVKGTLTLLEAARNNPRCRFIFGSSSSVYGNNAKVPFNEDDPIVDPQSPYAATKRAGELLCRTYHNLYKIPMTCLRFFTVYGPRQRPDLAIHKFMRCIEAGEAIPVFGDGSMRRDFTYVDDIVRGVCAAIETCNEFHIYNLGNSSPVSVLQLIALLEEVSGQRAMIRHLPAPPGDVLQTYADIGLAGRELGYAPHIDFKTGLTRFVEWFRENPPTSGRQASHHPASHPIASRQ